MIFVMEQTIWYQGSAAGALRMEADGLYWSLEARLNTLPSGVVRLYGVTGWESEPFGVFVPGQAGYCLHRRLSRRAVPTPPERWIAGVADGDFRPWVGTVEDQEIHNAMLAPTEAEEADAGALRLLALPTDCPPLPLAEYAAAMEPRELCGTKWLVLRLRDGAVEWDEAEQQEAPEEPEPEETQQSSPVPEQSKP